MPTNSESPVDFLPLHPESLRILLALRDEPLHGYAIVKVLERDPERAGRVLPANLYRRMRTLRDQGLIAESRAVGEAVEGASERRRYFEMTPVGRAVARAERERLRGLLAEVEEALGS